MTEPVTHALFLMVVLPSLAWGTRIEADGPIEQDVSPGLEQDVVLQPIEVRGRRIAVLRAAGSYSAPVTALRFDPQIDLQVRGLPEGQADVTLRGGLFENTAFRIGAVTVFDPQSGHYAAELPLDPAMLMPPEVLTDIEHAVGGFNANVATVSYLPAPVQDGGALEVAVGSNQLRSGRVMTGALRELPDGDTLGVDVSAALSEGDGTLLFSDYDFKRATVRLQHRANSRQTDVILGYQDKFFGWPGAYTGFSSLPETDHTKVGLMLMGHRHDTDDGWWEVGAAWRWLENDYDFDRRTEESGVPGSFEHETRSLSFGLRGNTAAIGMYWSWSAQFIADRLVRSTDLVGGDFSSRRYLSVSVMPGKNWPLASDWRFGVSGGFRVDYSNHDESALMPLLEFDFELDRNGALSRIGLAYTGTSQLPGYTALKSPETGLFGGNPDLSREYAGTVTLSASHDTGGWLLSAALFRRHDDNLVDWTYLKAAPFARQANPVDLQVTGFEAILRGRFDQFDLFLAYDWLHKEESYGAVAVDASFYALNYAEHRATLGLVWNVNHSLEVRADTEYRRQRPNSLRTSSDRAFTGSATVRFRPSLWNGWGLYLAVDNIADSDFQEFPGTPAMGRQLSLGLIHDC